MKVGIKNFGFLALVVCLRIWTCFSLHPHATADELMAHNVCVSFSIMQVTLHILATNERVGLCFH